MTLWPAADVCHGPWTLVEADLVRSRRLTSWPSLQTDIGNADGEWVHAEVLHCTSGPKMLITRRTGNLPVFCELVAQLRQSTPLSGESTPGRTRPG